MAIGSHAWDSDRQTSLGEGPIVKLGVTLASRGPAIQMRQLRRDHGSVDGIEAEIAADNLVIVLRLGPMPAQYPQLIGASGVLGDDHPPVAGRAQVFRREKREASIVADRAGAAALVLGADGLRRVFNHD